jgi:hypothetical protein
MNEEKIIEEVKKNILAKTTPVSIFLYGSYNTEEYLLGTSDLEIGVIKKDKISISKILRKIAEDKSTKELRLRIYSFDLIKLKKLEVDSPFTKSVFIRHLILTSKTIWGEKIIENLPLPSIDLIDTYREASFSTMRALSGIFFLRANRLEEAKEMGYKACLFATLSLEYLFGKFPIGFKTIVKLSQRLDITKEEKELINIAYAIRLGEKKVSKDELYDFTFKVITYCNQVVESQIKKKLKNGNKVVIK